MITLIQVCFALTLSNWILVPFSHDSKAAFERSYFQVIAAIIMFMALK